MKLEEICNRHPKLKEWYDNSSLKGMYAKGRQRFGEDLREFSNRMILNENVINDLQYTLPLAVGASVALLDPSAVMGAYADISSSLNLDYMSQIFKGISIGMQNYPAQTFFTKAAERIMSSAPAITTAGWAGILLNQVPLSVYFRAEEYGRKLSGAK